MSIKPLETEYKGYMFRSRLEARWAVFFDECGFKWEYEPEGYDIDGIRYLPDFRLHDVRTRGDKFHPTDEPFFVEVKGKMDEASREKIWSLANYCPVYVVGEIPYAKDEWSYTIAVSDVFHDDMLFFSYNTVDGDSYPTALFVDKDGYPALAGPDHDTRCMDIEKTIAALRKARMARF